ncbi:MAG: hypothetical protein KKF85_11925 [Gammaproteobacteria bacterium]|nr:hypothetical protein [Rhodocyclaceae bacterium]MBU3909063.1 hypothetical protein [Gammaproteobacteria bacterium]MBU3989371.1 hypothetical protein [Gammaproteobacteria bacterium]MBU4003274.1 hypothetical protein [Gammaproteobacteria bacterium]MBU4022106.1 hypothetical protein [Gammaproteobacteria bacterium]
MSKLEDKLTASIKPGRKRTAEKPKPVKPAAKPVQTVAAAKPARPRSTKVGAGSTAPQAQTQPQVRPQSQPQVQALHPSRVWPD